jgi:hypothetical protein
VIDFSNTRVAQTLSPCQQNTAGEMIGGGRSTRPDPHERRHSPDHSCQECDTRAAVLGAWKLIAAKQNILDQYDRVLVQTSRSLVHHRCSSVDNNQCWRCCCGCLVKRSRANGYIRLASPWLHTDTASLPLICCRVGQCTATDQTTCIWRPQANRISGIRCVQLAP